MDGSLRASRRGLRPIIAIVCIAVLAAAAAAVLGATGSGGGVAVTCHRVAAPEGSDAARGTRASPFRTANRLVRSLRPGETGCLRRGNYFENVKVTRAGTPGRRITIRGYPGEGARLIGRLWIARGADFVTVSHLYLDGRNRRALPSPTINADGVAFLHNDVTNRRTAICFGVGSEDGYGVAERPLIADNEIHRCGRLPPTNHEHGIYLQSTREALVLRNWIYDNADRGVQLYPDAQRSRIAHNVIDGNGQGVIFSGNDRFASSGNLVERNVITNARVRYNVEAYYSSGGPSGRGNVVRRNCLRGGRRDNGNGGIQASDGFTATDNVVADPRYANRKAGDFRLAVGSRCLPLLGDGSNAPGPGVAAPSYGLVVALRVRPRSLGRRRRLRLSGRVVGPRRGRARSVLIQLRRRKRWRPLARVRLRGGARFSTRRRLRPPRPGRTLLIRAIAPGAGRSLTVRVRRASH